jgi:hypothetical protein
VLKKAGIVVATAAAGLLAVSPLAFAGDEDRDGRHKKVEVEDVNHIDDSNKGLINVSEVSVCNNGDILSNIEDVVGVLAIADKVEATDDRKCPQGHKFEQ